VRGDRGRRAGACALALALVALLVALVLRMLPEGLGQALSWGVQAVTCLAACAGLAVRARSASGRLRRARALLSGSLLAGALGGVLAMVLHAGGERPVPSPADAVHFLFLPLCLAGLLSYPVDDDGPGSAARNLLDGVLAATGLWFVVHLLLLAPAEVGAGLPTLHALTVLAFPAADVLVVGTAVSVLARVADVARGELQVTAVGLVLFALSDVAYVALEARGRYSPNSWVGALAEVGLLLVAAGVVLAPRLAVGGRRGERALAALPHVPMVAALAVAAAHAAAGRELPAQSLVVGVLATALLTLRQAVATRDHVALHRRLQAREELFRSLVTGSSDLITLHDADGRVAYASPAVSRATGLAEHELLGRRLDGLVHDEDLPRVQAAFSSVSIRPGATGECSFRMRSAADGWRWAHSVMHNRLEHGSVRGMVCNTRDVHERHLLEGELFRAAHSDALTGLGNLAHARSVLARCCEDRRGTWSALLVDLDGFKAVNDSFGHARGDALLQVMAERLRDCVRADDDVARLGGDEFLLVVHDADHGGVTGLVERVLAAVRRPVDLAGTPVAVEASIGIATTADARTPDELLRNADLAMYAAKAAGRGRAVAYQPQMHETAARRMHVHGGLRRALDEGHLALHYQPIHRLDDGAVIGLEALLRWEDPDTGPVPPDVFVPVAEESGIIGEVDEWVLDRACADAVRWRAAGRRVPRISVNVSRRHLTADLPARVAGALERHGLAGSALCVEVTESAVVPDADTAITALTGVRALGVAVALDDFGTGQSSLSQLARLPLDAVKIDKSFLVGAADGEGSWRLLTSIVGVCRSLSLPVVAEGVEDAEVLRLLEAIGCEAAQGYHLGRPVPFDVLAGTLAPLVPAMRPAQEPAVRAGRQLAG
jgi:diguanylate cyclase (GGDEF)-like protein/PAS domain S-box-containing protein